MSMKKSNRLLLILMVVMLLFTACPATEDPTELREGTIFDTLKYQAPDSEEFYLLASEIESLLPDAEAAGNAAEVLVLFDQLLEEYYHIETMYGLAFIQNSLDVTDQYYMDEMAKSYELMLETHTEALRIAKAVLDSPCREEAFRHWGEEIAEEYIEAVLNTEEQNAMLAKEQEIILEYQIAAQEQISVDFKNYGKISLEEAAQKIGSYDEWGEFIDIYYRQSNRILGAYFMELVALRTELARSYGYENYAELAYDSFERCYTPEDVKNLFDGIPAMVSVFEGIYLSEDHDATDPYWNYALDLSVKDIMNMVSPYLRNVDPKMNDAYGFMLDNGLYDFEDNPNKDSGAYVLYLAEPNLPFMFINPYHDSDDINTFIHEFGHFNNNFRNGELYRRLLPSNNLDLMEIHSQGLELLFAEMAEEVFGEDDYVYSYRYYTLESMLHSVVDGALIGRFEIMVYENPDYTLEEINEAMGRLLDSYDSWYYDELNQYYWTNYPHLYQAGGYYVSYSTSALSALELWLKAQDNWDEGVAIYLNTIEQGANKDYRDALQESGLGDPFTPGYVENIARRLMEALEQKGIL